MIAMLRPLGVVLSLALASCMVVPVPTPPIVTLEKPPDVDLDPLEPGEAVAVLAADATGSVYVAQCVQEQLAEALPRNRVLPPEEARDLLFPWLEIGAVPKDDAAAQALIGRPAVAAKLQELRLRYLIDVGLFSTSTGGGASFDLGGIYAGTASAHASAWVVDLEAGCCRTGGTATATGFAGSAGLVWAIGFFPVIEGPACGRLSAALVEQLQPRPVSAP